MHKYLMSTVMASTIAIAGTTPASAQEQGQIGLVMGYPAAVGLVWHTTDRVAVRSTISFSRSSTDVYIPDIAIPFEGLIFSADHSTFSTVSVGFSGLLYLSKADGVSSYVSPQYSRRRTSRNMEYDSPYSGAENSTGDVQATDSLAGSFGVQYAPNRKFSAFGEVGIEHERYDSPSILGLTAKNRAFGTRAGIGVTLYFGK